MESSPPLFEKWVWATEDYDQMGWHDSWIHAMGEIAENYEFVLDIDYILKWVEPERPGGVFSFWVAPATLVFENVSNVHIEVHGQSGDIQLGAIVRSYGQPTPNGKEVKYLWLLDGLWGGTGSLRATGFTQYFRRPPVLSTDQKLSYLQRRGLSFGRDHV